MVGKTGDIMIDITSLKSQLTDDRIIELMDAMGAPLMKKIFIKILDK